LLNRPLIALFAAVVLCAGVAPSARADTVADLRRAGARLNELLDGIEEERGEISALEAAAARLAGRIDAVQSAIAEAQAAILGVRLEVRDASEELQAIQGQLDGRARNVFETGPGTGLEFLLGARSLFDLSTRLKVVDRAAQTDRDLIDRVRELRAALGARELELEDLEAGLSHRREGLGGAYGELSAKLESAQRLRDQMEADRSEAEKLVESLREKRRKEVRAERQRLARLAMQSPTSSGGSGGWVTGLIELCPVQGAVAYWDDFGAPRYSGGYHQHAGNDMFAPHGTPVVAPFRGTAVTATNSIGGLAVKVFGENGWVYNAHLSSIGRLGDVEAGEVIGYVGDTGNAKGTAPHNHFEWHPLRPPSDSWTSPYGANLVGSAVDPYPYLNAVC
jgi:peptidoglycan LD-endopeptidase LytH